ncbi:MAG TPA: type II secretion system protein [Jatrophihabitans sp.]|nr:type II secretion system protein [Jatrophihabitans sp.]
MLSEERGETLIELLVALAILGIALVAVIGAFGASIAMSDVHRKQASAGAAVRNYAEQVAYYVADTGYTACAAPSAYAAGTVGYTAPAGYTASPLSVRYWSGSAWSASCGSDTGLQQLTVSVSSADTRAVEQVTVVLRKPCGAGSTC